MDQQNEQTLEEVSIANTNEFVNNKNSFLAFYQSNFIKIEIRSYFFYSIQILEMLFITVISTLPIFTASENDNTSINFFNSLLSYFYMSPSLFSHLSFTYLVIGIVILLIIIIFGYTFLVGFKIRKNEASLSSNSLKSWVVLYRLLLPFPGFIIGCNFGYYFIELTKKLYSGQLFLIIYTGMFWCWCLITSNSLYNSQQYKRKYDICQIHHKYNLFEFIISILPMVQAVLPYIITVFVPTTSSTTFYSSLTIILSISIIIFVLLAKPYYSDFMNQYIVFLSILKIPISFTWTIEKSYPNKFEVYLLFCFVFAIAVYALIKFISSCFHRIPNTTHTQAQINQNQNGINIQSQDSDLQLDFQPVEEHSNQSSTFDPFINCRYPFNIISMTYQDIAVTIYIATTVLFMVLANAIAAQRMPLREALPDLVQEKFHIADYLRTKVANSPFQISNIVILVQIPLFAYFIFVHGQYINIRRLVFLYGSLCAVRGVAFLVTGLPAPCTGEPNCPCADPSAIQTLKEGNPLKIAASWAFGLGIFLTYPQCGDLIISGHTMWLWLMTKTLCSVIEELVSSPFNSLANGSLKTLTVIALGYIILSKNHYTIDVWFGFIFSEFSFILYNTLTAQSLHPPHDDDSLSLKVIRFIETRPKTRMLMQTRKMQLQNNS